MGKNHIQQIEAFQKDIVKTFGLELPLNFFSLIIKDVLHRVSRRKIFSPNIDEIALNQLNKFLLDYINPTIEKVDIDSNKIIVGINHPTVPKKFRVFKSNFGAYGLPLYQNILQTFFMENCNVDQSYFLTNNILGMARFYIQNNKIGIPDRKLSQKEKQALNNHILFLSEQVQRSVFFVCFQSSSKNYQNQKTSKGIHHFAKKLDLNAIHYLDINTDDLSNLAPNLHGEMKKITVGDTASQTVENINNIIY